jgi:hypothetical protein
MQMPNIESAVSWTGISAFVLSLMTLMVRFVMKTVRTDRLESTVSNADNSSYDRLQNEIKRLEKAISVEKSRTDELEARLDRLRDMELDDVSDISALFVLLSSNCSVCPNGLSTHDEMIRILISMKARKVGGMAIIRGTVIQGTP